MPIRILFTNKILKLTFIIKSVYIIFLYLLNKSQTNSTMKLKQILLFTLCITFFGCSSESSNDKDDEETIDDTTLLKRIIYNKSTTDEYIETFNYDGNKLTSIDYGDGSRHVYSYDQDNNLIKYEYFNEGVLNASVDLTYNSDSKIATYTETFFEDSGLDDRQYRHTFSHNNDGTITSTNEVNYDNNGFEFDRTETFVLNGKNIVEISDNEGYNITYTYDNKNGAYKNIHAIEILNILSENEFGAVIFGNTNNITAYVETEETPGDNNNETFEYTYNEKDYPLTCVYTSLNGDEIEDIETIDFEYE